MVQKQCLNFLMKLTSTVVFIERDLNDKSIEMHF